MFSPVGAGGNLAPDGKGQGALLTVVKAMEIFVGVVLVIRRVVE